MSPIKNHSFWGVYRERPHILLPLNKLHLRDLLSPFSAFLKIWAEQRIRTSISGQLRCAILRIPRIPLHQFRIFVRAWKIRTFNPLSPMHRVPACCYYPQTPSAARDTVYPHCDLWPPITSFPPQMGDFTGLSNLSWTISDSNRFYSVQGSRVTNYTIQPITTFWNYPLRSNSANLRFGGRSMHAYNYIFQ